MLGTGNIERYSHTKATRTQTVAYIKYKFVNTDRKTSAIITLYDKNTKPATITEFLQ